EAAAGSLAELKDARHGSAILQRVDDADADPFVHSALLRALRELRVPKAFAAAMAGLESGSAPVRREAVGVLGYLKRPEGLGALTRVATNDDDPIVRRAAVGALGYAADVDVLPALAAALRDPAWQVREEAAATMGKLLPA